jgi:hypothetical protein
VFVWIFILKILCRPSFLSELAVAWADLADGSQDSHVPHGLITRCVRQIADLKNTECLAASFVAWQYFVGKDTRVPVSGSDDSLHFWPGILEIKFQASLNQEIFLFCSPLKDYISG